MIPEDWDFMRLEDIATVERGKFSVRPRNDPRYYGGLTPFIQTGDIASSGGYLKYYTQTLNKEGVSISKLFPSGTILITIAANIGDIALTQFEVAVPDSIVAIIPKIGTDTKWLFQYLFTQKEVLDKSATQNAQKNINLQVLRPLQILVPPLPEQHKIAEILSTWDKAIALLEQLITAKRKLKQGLMQQLLTGKKRFNGFSDWQEKYIGDLITFSGGSQPPKNTFIFEPQDGYIRLIQIRDYKTDNFAAYIPRNLAKKFCSKDDVMIGRYGPPIFQILKGIEGAYNVALIKATPNKELDKNYMFYFLKQEVLYKFIESLSQRTSGQTGIEMDQLTYFFSHL